jgi:hypothetical protein
MSVGQREMSRLGFGSLVAGLVGVLSGFAAQWPVALLSMRLNGAGYSGVAPHWDPRFAAFDASLHGAPVGGIVAIGAYLLFFSSYPPALIARWVPTLFAFTLLGALPGIWLGPGALFTVVPLFLGGCVFVARRLARERPELVAHPLR